MNVLETFLIAFWALKRNKTRSALTTLGIVIGVGAVIAMVGIGEGAKRKVQETFESMGVNQLVILPGSSSAGGTRGGFGSKPTVTWDDLRAIKEGVSSVKYAAPVLRASQPVVSDITNWTTTVYGTTPDYFSIRNWAPASGSLFAPEDGDSKVVVLGQTVAEKLFGSGTNPVGQAVRIGSTPYEVVGVLQSKGQSAGGGDNDDAVFIPARAFQSKVRGGLGNFIDGMVMVGATSPEATRFAETQITDLLRERHHLQDGEPEDFSLRNLADVASSREESTRTLTLLLASIAAVSLLVGGIGVMNIMLVSVTERTREIGVRMALGAKPRHILAQFLVEALTLTVAGGVLGIALGVLVAERLATQFGWPTLVQPQIILVSVGFSAAVGVIFGLYPARRASMLDPIEALRYE
ncbi:FtsX-like permease family protein [Aggregicoccus sp. 17bor-14]|uniref:ABC transporter permease n=1 Tax=Myxococcaceae TaxID=31 RepID=UPI00129CFD22|nr:MULTISPECIES: ABC transporter permease [Myxococcaceae]MBF5042351.1 ABC transporter permease [Simulacricoccus sp. 17bor-14]MRI88124.1 FtsX-like permease family protein [Aggregicoccus sp. 17bor-14]